MDCSRLGTMLHPEIQRGKEATKASKFQQNIRGTAACMKILMMYTKVESKRHQGAPNFTIDDSAE